MATWMVHLRIADGIRKRIPFLDRLEFLMGNIAPDSGVPNEDWSVYTPEKVFPILRLTVILIFPYSWTNT